MEQIQIRHPVASDERFVARDQSRLMLRSSRPTVLGLEMASFMCAPYRFEGIGMFAVCWIAALSCSASAAEATAGQTASDKRTSVAQSDPELEARFRSEAPEAWAELEAFARKLRGAYTFESN